MPVPATQLRADFDRLADLDTDASDTNAAYHSYLLRRLPPTLGTVLDLGCGTGAFTRLLAQRSARVIAVDQPRRP